MHRMVVLSWWDGAEQSWCWEVHRVEDVPCNLCDTKDEELRFEKDGCRIVRCRKCGLVYVNPRPADDELRLLYTEDHPCYNRRPEDAVRRCRNYVRRIERLAPPGDLLDVGCGSGEFLLAAKERRWRGTGLDVSEYATRYAREHYGLSVRTGHVCDLDLAPESFDVITLWATIEHLQDPMGDLRLLATLLRPRGLIAVETGNIGGLRPRLEGARWPLLSPPEHLYFFSRRTLGTMFAECGLRVVRVDTTGRILPFSTPILKQIGGKLGWGDLMYVYALKS